MRRMRREKSDRWTEGKKSDRWTEGKKPDRWTEGKKPDRWTEGKKSDRWTEGKKSDRWTEGKKSDRWTEGKTDKMLVCSDKQCRWAESLPDMHERGTLDRQTGDRLMYGTRKAQSTYICRVPQCMSFIFVPSSELGLYHPSLASGCAPPPGTKGGGEGAHSPAGEGLGESQFRRLERKLSTLPTLWRKVDDHSDRDRRQSSV